MRKHQDIRQHLELDAAVIGIAQPQVLHLGPHRPVNNEDLALEC